MKVCTDVVFVAGQIVMGFEQDQKSSTIGIDRCPASKHYPGSEGMWCCISCTKWLARTHIPAYLIVTHSPEVPREFPGQRKKPIGWLAGDPTSTFVVEVDSQLLVGSCDSINTAQWAYTAILPCRPWSFSSYPSQIIEWVILATSIQDTECMVVTSQLFSTRINKY